MFSGASTVFGADANEHVSFVDAGMPAMLPVLNERCVHQAVKTGLGLNAKINKYSQFSRKNYFYADLPQGYQITQFQYPIVGEGKVVINLEDGSSKEIGIERMHIEQDAGKSIHDIDPKKTYIDLNRAGVGLMEIVTKPDFRSPEEAGAFLKSCAPFCGIWKPAMATWTRVPCAATSTFRYAKSVKTATVPAAK